VWAKIAEREDAGRGYSLTRDRSRSFWLWVYQTFLTELGYPDAARSDLPEQLFNTFVRQENYRLYEDAMPTLERFQNTGLTLGVISNWEEWLERLMVGLGIRDYFHCVVVSGLSGVEKPDAEIFQRALEAAGVRPEEALHVGDSLRDDVQGAEAVGIRAVLLDRFGRYDNETAGNRTATGRQADGATGGAVIALSPSSPVSPPADSRLVIRSLLDLPVLLGL
jgi:REG-2-like HAD superfamily hydrolase